MGEFIIFLGWSIVVIVYLLPIADRGTNEGQLEGPDSAKFLFPLSLPLVESNNSRRDRQTKKTNTEQTPIPP